MNRAVSVTAAAALGMSLLASCGSDTDDGRPGTVAPTGTRGLTEQPETKVDFESTWWTDGATDVRDGTSAGGVQLDPAELTATCYGDYPDLRVKVEAPNSATLEAAAGEAQMTFEFGDLGPVPVDVRAEDYTWDATGLDIDTRILDGGAVMPSTPYPEDRFGVDNGYALVKMRVICD